MKTSHLLAVALALHQSVNAAIDLDHLEGSVVMLKCPYPVTKNIDGRNYEVWLKHPDNGALIREDRVPTGTGFLVQGNLCNYIATARHVAVEMGTNCIVTARAPANMPVEIKLVDFIITTSTNPIPTIPWLLHTNADCAILPLSNGSSGYKKLSHVCWATCDMMASGLEAPPKTEPLTGFGFGLGFGVQITFSPITFERKAASGLLTAGGVNYFFLQGPGIDGFSGAPFFRSGAPRPIAQSTTSLGIAFGKPICWGLLSATDSDTSGGKMARIIHSSHILELINGFEKQFTWMTNQLPVVASDAATGIK